MHISCKTGKNIGKVLTLIDKVWQRTAQQFSKEELTALLGDALIKKPFFSATKSFVLFSARQIRFAPITNRIGC